QVFHCRRGIGVLEHGNLPGMGFLDRFVAMDEAQERSTETLPQESGNIANESTADVVLVDYVEGATDRIGAEEFAALDGWQKRGRSGVGQKYCHTERVEAAIGLEGGGLSGRHVCQKDRIGLAEQKWAQTLHQEVGILFQRHVETPA